MLYSETNGDKDSYKDEYFKTVFPEIEKEIKYLKPLEIKVKYNPNNPKRSIIYWGELENATTYILSFNNEIIYVGRNSYFYSKYDLNYGKYISRIIANTKDSNRETGGGYEIFIGLEPSEITSPKDASISKNAKPTIEWSYSDNADYYELYQNGKKIYSGIGNSIELDLAVGKYKFDVITINKFQNVRSKSVNIEIITIKSVKPVLPVNDDKIYTFNLTENPSFKWESEEKDAIYELYIDYQLIYRGKDTSYTLKKETKPLITGKHSWYVTLDKDNQTIESKTMYYSCIENAGYTIGLIAGPNLSRPSMRSDFSGKSTSGAFGGGVGLYLNYIFPYIKAFELDLVIELFYDYRYLILPDEDWITLMKRYDNSMNYCELVQHWLYVPVMVRPTLRKSNFVFYGLLGLGFDIHLGGRVKNNPDNFYNYDKLKPSSNLGFSIPVALGINYRTNYTLWQHTKMSFGFEIRYYQSITKELSNFSNKNSNYGSMFNIELMFLFSTVLLEI